MNRYCFAGCVLFVALAAPAQSVPPQPASSPQPGQPAQPADPTTESPGLMPAPPTFSPDAASGTAQKPRGPVRISGGVMAGNLQSRVEPVYPPDAKAKGMQGAVVLDTLIGKTGTVQEVRVLSGPAVLASAALDAVRQWTYKPYVLNGQPAQVRTTVTVNFQLAQPAPTQ